MLGTLGELLPYAAARYGDKLAIVVDGIPLTFNELNERSNAVANALIGAEVRPGDKVKKLLVACSLAIVLTVAACALGLSRANAQTGGAARMPARQAALGTFRSEVCMRLANFYTKMHIVYGIGIGSSNAELLVRPVASFAGMERISYRHDNAEICGSRTLSTEPSCGDLSNAADAMRDKIAGLAERVYPSFLQGTQWHKGSLDAGQLDELSRELTAFAEAVDSAAKKSPACDPVKQFTASPPDAEMLRRRGISFASLKAFETWLASVAP